MTMDVEGAAIIIRIEENYLFTLSKERYWISKPDGILIPYGMVGGKIEPGEDAESAAIREAKEETGCQVKLLRPRDLIIIRETRVVETRAPTGKHFAEYEVEYPGEPGDPDAEGSFTAKVYVFVGRLESNPSPESEIPALLYLNESLLKKTLDRTIPLQELLDEGGRLVEKRPIPRDARIFPIFTPEVLGAALGGQLSKFELSQE